MSELRSGSYLAGQLSLLAELGEQFLHLLDADRASSGLVPRPAGEGDREPGRDPAPETTREA